MAKRNMSEYQAKRSRKPPRYNPNSRINNQGHKYFDGSEEGNGKYFTLFISFNFLNIMIVYLFN